MCNTLGYGYKSNSVNNFIRFQSNHFHSTTCHPLVLFTVKLLELEKKYWCIIGLSHCEINKITFTYNHK